MGYGMTIPLDGVPLAEHGPVLEELRALGYSDVWSTEATGTDAFTPLALAASVTPELQLGCAIVPAYTRGPALLAQSVAALAELAPGRFTFGIGASSNVIIEQWNGVPFEHPYERVRDTVRFLKQALSGEKVDFTGAGFSCKGFRLGRPPAVMPKILIAALRPGMLRLAGRESDGAIINWLSAADVARVVPEVHRGRRDDGDKEIVARIFVCPSDDLDAVRAAGRFAIAAYLNVPVYAAFHEWLGRRDALAGMWDAWRARDRKQALTAIPDTVVDDLIVHGTPAECRAHIQRYLDNGVTTAVLSFIPFRPLDVRSAIRALAPEPPSRNAGPGGASGPNGSDGSNA